MSNPFIEESMKEQDAEPQVEQEKEEEEVVHYDDIDREHYVEGAGDA